MGDKRTTGGDTMEFAREAAQWRRYAELRRLTDEDEFLGDEPVVAIDYEP
jgi:hypothetical protein